MTTEPEPFEGPAVCLSHLDRCADLVCEMPRLLHRQG
jgi:hypothetical protein